MKHFVAALILAAILTPPSPMEPLDDPEFEQCLNLTPANQVLLRWWPQKDEGVTTWLVVKRRYGSDEWRTWVKTFVKSPPFSMSMRSPLARNGDFAWKLFSVDRATNEYVDGEWQFFCTREAPEDAWLAPPDPMISD